MKRNHASCGRSSLLTFRIWRGREEWSKGTGLRYTYLELHRRDVVASQIRQRRWRGCGAELVAVEVGYQTEVFDGSSADEGGEGTINQDNVSASIVIETDSKEGRSGCGRLLTYPRSCLYDLTSSFIRA